MTEKINELFQDETFVENLLSKETDIEVKALLAENGVEISLEEISAIKKTVEARLENDSELSEDDLENVAGGSDVSDIITGVVDGLVKLGDAIHNWSRRRW